MRLTLLALAIAAAVLPASALAKGPSAVTIDGAGTSGGMTFGGNDGGGMLGTLTQQAGLFPAVFGEQPSPMLPGPPEGALGPRYTLIWTVPGGSGEAFSLRQDVYPYATPAPVTYMKPGQPVFGQRTVGGWFQADAALKQTLVAAGLPSSAPESAPESPSFPTGLASLFALFVLFAAATAFLIRRRTRPAAA